MSAERLEMRKIKEVLRFKFECGMTSGRQIAKATGCGRTAVGDYLRRAEIAHLNAWEKISALNGRRIRSALVPRNGGAKFKNKNGNLASAA